MMTVDSVTLSSDRVMAQIRGSMKVFVISILCGLHVGISEHCHFRSGLRSVAGMLMRLDLLLSFSHFFVFHVCM